VKRSEYRVGRISAAELHALAACRGLDGWSLCPVGPEEYWLRVPLGDEEIFRKLPMLGRWISDAAGALVRDGRRVPEVILPEDGWQSLSIILTVNPPVRTSLGMPPPAISFHLEMDSSDRPAGAVLCRIKVFAEWAETAFAPRLECLRFASCEDGRAFVTGMPLPAVPGMGFHQLGRLWLPCGYRLPDHVWVELLEEMMGLGRNRMAMIHPDGSHEELDDENLVSATRAAVRVTVRENHSIG
jgi:hypothetical protein